jgi:putative N6-adenine-specific DNA methylase|uniref:Class I SAM-dependent RNA methyltransferase n=1 Tax=Mesoaciditoga lauensis TaxID=1495039 RepID=A0A7V3RFB2_9BACT
MEKFELMAATAFGIESVTNYELKKLGYETKAEDGRVNFEGTFSDIARTNLWLRTSNRILIKAGEFDATDFDTLFERTFSIEWDELLTEDATFPVELSSVKSKLSSAPACQSIIKKAIVERMKKRYHINHFPEDGPQYKIIVHIVKDRVTLGIDTTGESLNRRGYRVNISEAPLKETLAASIVLLSKWKNRFLLWDGFCGSGTIPIEAAMIAKNIAPGSLRRFVFEEWKNFPRNVIESEREKSMDLISDDPVVIIGTDEDEQMIEFSKRNAKRIGVDKIIDFRVSKFEKFVPEAPGFFISNLPYGMRTDENDLDGIYREIRRKFSSNDWRLFLLTADENFEKKFLRADGNRKLFNGRIEVRLYRYEGRKYS